VISQAYTTLMDAEKRQIYQRIMKEAYDRTVFEREMENKSRAKKGLINLPEDTFESDFKLNCRRVFDEIEDKKNHLLKMDQNSVKRRNQELELLSLKEHYKVLTEEEWEKTRENRIKKWKFFQQKGNKIGTKASDGSIRLPKKRFDQERRFWLIKHLVFRTTKESRTT